MYVYLTNYSLYIKANMDLVGCRSRSGKLVCVCMYLLHDFDMSIFGVLNYLLFFFNVSDSLNYNGKVSLSHTYVIKVL